MPEQPLPLPTPPPSGKSRRLILDIDKYQQMLDAPDLTDAQREEFLKAVWTILVCFVDLGFDITPEETCGQSEKRTALPAFVRAAVVSSKPSQDKTEAADV